ncbi:hypothetical protein J2Z21_004480 [Streptomyces griseochromogenes]|uniref:Uncharacterized protein n=1 Tax=Streptomyces griseochromogenes TaxID=68214 RepID=A0A1B1AVW2_9ACTN|nr:hypothetical protein [Streptomyces griseochromogenes]ANP50716.1 hypothetical protein AVL59_14745 [Streptomyces griseochromogenes]MBP2051509.1 hypothetical protein [Streptomyces griseochromogenes]
MSETGSPIKLLIKVDGQDDAHHALRSLDRWLDRDPEVRTGTLSRELTALEPPETTYQSAWFDVLSLVLSTGFNAASLWLGIDNWRRGRAPSVTVTIVRPGREAVRLDGVDPATEQRLLEELLGGEDG